MYVRPNPATLQNRFPLVNGERMAALPKKEAHRHPTVLNIGMSATSLFDHGYRSKEGASLDDDEVLNDFHAHMERHKDVPMPIRPEASVALSLLDANYLALDAMGNPEPLVILHLFTRLSGPSYERLINSYKAAGMFDTDFANDFVPVSKFTDRLGKYADFEEMVRAALNLGIDFFFASSIELAEMMNVAGIGAGILMSNPGTEHYNALDTRYYCFDGDGVLFSDYFERFFQEVYEECGGDINKAKARYYDFVLQTKEEHMQPGPSLALAQGISRLADLFDSPQDGQVAFMKNGLITTRDDRGSIAFPMFFGLHGVRFDQTHLVSGNIKNPYAAGAIAMIEDGEGHLERMVTLMGADIRPPSLVLIPFGEKHERKKAGKAVIADGRGTAGGNGGLERP